MFLLIALLTSTLQLSFPVHLDRPTLDEETWFSSCQNFYKNQYTVTPNECSETSGNQIVCQCDEELECSVTVTKTTGGGGTWTYFLDSCNEQVIAQDNGLYWTVCFDGSRQISMPNLDAEMPVALWGAR